MPAKVTEVYKINFEYWKHKKYDKLIQFYEVFIKFLEFKQIGFLLKNMPSVFFLGLETKCKAD